MLTAAASRPRGVSLSPSCDSRYDFFIVSQAVRSGSVSPTHYNVIYDNSGLKPDHIQRLTYKLCHVYYNWPVSVPRGPQASAGPECRGVRLRDAGRA